MTNPRLTTSTIDPIDYLRHVVDGVDVRKPATLLNMAVEIEENRLGDVSADDWETLLNAIKDALPGKPVSTQESMAAAKELAKYLYPQRKPTDTPEINGDAATHENRNTRLTSDEIVIFKEIFNDEF